MKLHYYPETDSLYIELKAGASVETREIVDGLNADFDAAGVLQFFALTRRANIPGDRDANIGVLRWREIVA